jgi:hypothetical protein
MLTRSLRATAVVLACIATTCIVARPAYAEQKPCGYFDFSTNTFVACASENTTTSTDSTQAVSSDSGDQGDASSDGSDCHYVDMAAPPSGDLAWSFLLPPGADPADYRLEMKSCTSGGINSAEVFPVRRIRNDPPPDPRVVAQEAVAKLPVPLPAIQVGPNIQRVAVNIPVWLWVSNPQAVTASSTDRTVTVTATATLGSVTWSMGEPGAEPFACQGAGSAPWPGADLWQPPCGYTYRLRSLPSRTDGAGVWPVTATASWAITWRANTGTSGTDTVTTRSTLGLNVGEYRTVIIADNG